MIYDIAIVGNGILGSTLSLELTKLNKNLKIALIGPKNKFGSASVASGAMINVFAEIENNFLDNKYLAKRFDLDIKALQLWKKHHKNLENQSGDKIEVSWGTYVLNSSRGTKYEDRLFEYLENLFNKKEYKKFQNKIINPDKISGLSAQAPHRPIRSIMVEDGIINSKQLLKSIDKIIENKKNIDYFDSVAKKINYSKSQSEIIIDNGKIQTSNIVLANGAYAQKLVDQINCTVLLKGPCTYMGFTDGSVFFNFSPNDGMATGGAGDVLAGILGGMLAQYTPIKQTSGMFEDKEKFYQALCLGVVLHTYAGKHAAEKLGEHSMTAMSIIDHLPDAFKELDEID